jgi:MoaA/NifB/PqqE/SkfB family radical SAM enzyme
VASSRAGNGVLSLERFKALLEANPEVRIIELSNYGEVFLNKELASILECAADQRVEINLENGVNLNFARPEQLEALVKHQVGVVNVALDGASQETYGKYRLNGSLDKVLANVRKINEFKQQYASDRPHLVWQFILFSFNEHEVPVAREMANQYGMQFYLRKNWDSGYCAVEKPLEEPEQLPIRPDLQDSIKSLPIDGNSFPLCAQLWLDPQVNWDGEVLGCCVNFWGSFGNAFDQTVQEVMNSESYLGTQQMLSGVDFEPTSPCIKCGIFWNKFVGRNFFHYFAKAPVKWKWVLTRVHVKHLLKKLLPPARLKQG